ncbi:thymidylate synthase [Candidatus Woesearchaeota archaeon]|nr:thymidylate synthase [Candidatus Woesearchaeota archaeon]
MIKGKNSMQAWSKALKHIFESGKDFKDQTNRVCREMLNVLVTVENPKDEVSAPIEKLNSLSDWVYPKLELISDVILRKTPSLLFKYSYGRRLFSFNGKVNQIDDYVIPLLKKNAETRRAVAAIFEPENDSVVSNQNVPGLMVIDFKIRDNKLNMVAVIRSCDLFFGWPANIYQLYVLQEYVREKVGCELGTLSTFLSSAHIFEDQFANIKKIIK